MGSLDRADEQAGHNHLARTLFACGRRPKYAFTFAKQRESRTWFQVSLHVVFSMLAF